MKLLAILIVFLIATTAMGKINRVRKSVGRVSSPETVTLPFIYLGTCDQFNAIPHVSISSLPATGCLPVNNAVGFGTTDDLTADVLCTNIGRNRAQIDFVEIYKTNENTAFTDPYAISFVPNAPFKAISTGVTYLKRPSCTTQKDYCSTTNYVLSCTEGPAVLKNGFVISTNDEVFVVPNGQATVGCGSAINSCCSYVNSLFCPRNATTDVLNFNWDSLHEHHDEHHHGHDGDNDHDDHHHGHNDHEEHHNDHNNHHNDGDNDHDDHHDGHNDHNNHHNDHNNHHNDGDNDHDDHHDGHNDHNNHHNDHNGHNNVVFDDNNDDEDKKKK